GGGWSMADFPGGAPTASILDEVTANRPIILLSADHHSAWVNRAAIDLVGAHVPPDDEAASRAGLRAGQSYLHRLGVTAWMDAIIGDYSGHRSPCDAYVATEISTVTNELTVCDGRIVFDIAEGARRPLPPRTPLKGHHDIRSLTDGAPEHPEREEELRREHRHREDRSVGARGRIPLTARTLGMREDDPAADDRRFRASH